MMRSTFVMLVLSGLALTGMVAVEGDGQYPEHQEIAAAAFPPPSWILIDEWEKDGVHWCSYDTPHGIVDMPCP